jgi:alpha-L-arabinofuranosidase
MFSIAQSVNVISPTMTSPDSLYLQTTYFPLLLFSKHMRAGQSLGVHVKSSVYRAETSPNWLQFADKPLPFLDVSAMATLKKIV